MVIFFDLARELRDLIYVYYVSTPDGYVYDPETRKLKVAANGEPIDLSLMYTCKQVAYEMHGIALGTNTITFLPWLSDNTTPARFHSLQESMEETEEDLLTVSSTFIRRTPMLRPLLVEKYPNFLLRLQDRTRIYEPREDSWSLCCPSQYMRRNGRGDIPSVHHDAVQFTLQKLASDPSWESSIWPIWRRHFRMYPLNGHGISMKQRDVPRPSRLVEFCLSTPCWSLPTAQGVDNMAAALNRGNPKHHARFWRRVTGNYHFSATAVAILFLKSMAKETRLQLRRLLLDETQVAVAFPECHARGLISYCQENSNLRIERRLNMWTNVLRGTIKKVSYPRTTRHVSHIIAPWLVESMALIPAGMPPQCFSIMLDGGPLPLLDKCSELFEIMQRDAAWQLAWESCVAHGSVTHQHANIPDDDDDQRYIPPLDASPDSEYSDYTSDESEYADAGDPDAPFRPDNYWKYAEWDSFVKLADIHAQYMARLSPIYIMDQFPHVIRDIVNKSPLVRCNFDTSYTWDVQQVVEMAQRNNWSDARTWIKEWDNFEHVDFRKLETWPPLPPWTELMEEDDARIDSVENRLERFDHQRTFKLEATREGRPNNCHRYMQRTIIRRIKRAADEPKQQADSSLPTESAQKTRDHDSWGPSDTSSDEG